MTRPSVYLAGCMAGLTFQQASNWRRAVTLHLAQCEIAAINPLRLCEFPGDDELIPASVKGQGAFDNDRGITRRDLNDIRRCDVVLANYLNAPGKGIGTALEIGFATALNKPIVLVIEEEGNPNDHAMIRECAGWTASSLREAVAIIEGVLS